MPTANNDLFSVDKITHKDGTVSATLGINPGSEILKGHFPSQPVVPGACMLQIVKEVLENALNHPLRLKKADQLKFMIMIDPAHTLVVNLDISYQYPEDGIVSVSAKLSNADVVYFKFSGGFIVQ